MSTEPDANKTGSTSKTHSTGNRHPQDKKEGSARSFGGKRNTTGPTPRYHGSTSTHDGSVKAKGSGWESAHKGRHRPGKDEHRKPRETHSTRNLTQSGKTHNRKNNASNKSHPPAQTTEDTVDKQEETVQEEDRGPLENEAPLIEEEGGTDLGAKDLCGNSNRLVYTRDDLLLLKEVTLSLLSPVPHFDTMEVEIVKEILKRHNSSSSSNNDPNDPETDLVDDMKPKHPATLSLIREHDPKTSAKVTLSPQRRSFGSGCSWRESPVKNGPQAPPTNQTNNGDSAESEKDEVFYHHRVTTPSSHKVIDHIPYRSRGNGGKGEWQEPPKRRGSSWRESVDTGRLDEEPEWMSYGPTDCNEIMELKGMEDHELEREAIKPGGTNVSSVDDKQIEEGGVSSDPSPSSSVGDTSKDDYDSGLPSSSPYDDDQEFMLDGFDFSTGVSICRALASDSDEEEATPINNNNNKEGLPAITDKHQLTNALLNVLKIPPGGSGEAPTRPLRAMTLDEIEEPRPQEVDQDQSAFNKLLAAINSPHGGPPGTGIEGHVSHGRREQYQVPPTSGHVNRTLFSDESEQLQPLQLRGGGRYQTHQEWTHPRWGVTGGVAYRPNLYKSHHSVQVRPGHTLSQQSSGQQHGISWVSEMELRRRSELNQIMAEKERQERQLLAAEKERQRVITQRSNNSSLSFLPTSVIRQMHSKPAGTTLPTHLINNSMEVPPIHTNSYDRDYQPPLHMLSQSSGIPFHHNTAVPHHNVAVPHHIHSHHMGGAASINNGRTMGTPVDTMASGFTHPMQYRMTYPQQQ
ncbi:PREDICTED: uncharacterized protein LOC100639191 isoform X1 [Amphimedon queenslandica]|uniref:Uncharacterized protein n=1 Tax=Amphimedon queenslandica TaxID=400682 RepID=A0A1X7UR47_AMPQE|nr:PREDICTED: uncharacterized protein LOC100639191 isoform X1 [Amphimedon queenslandica]|eukprot:XP_003387130.1 PREDICTED: uncharacterized protein LOC100639191 isoform X1 [Amphimedon queenslandica]